MVLLRILVPSVFLVCLVPSLAKPIAAAPATQELYHTTRTVGALLELPTLLQDDFRHQSVTIQTRTFDSAVQSRKEKKLRCDPPNTRSSPWMLFCDASRVRPSNNLQWVGHELQREQLANVIIDRLIDRFAERLERASLLSIPTDDNSRLEIKARIRRYGVARMLGKPIGDKWARYWWELRLNEDENPIRLVPRRGSRVLIAARTIAQKKTFIPIGTFGHAALGTIVLGRNSGNGDFFLNPGSNPPPGFKPSIKSNFIGDERITNHIEVSNFWDFLETQRVKRHLDIEVRLLTVTPLQQKVTFDFVDEAPNVSFGKFNIVTNNCSHGARDFFNSLLRPDQEIHLFQFTLNHFLKPHKFFTELLPIIMPEKVMRGASSAFHEFGNFLVKADKGPSLSSKPPPGFTVDHHPIASGANESYNEYVRWLNIHSQYL